jgi:hypothetical protein
VLSVSSIILLPPYSLRSYGSGISDPQFVFEFPKQPLKPAGVTGGFYSDPHATSFQTAIETLSFHGMCELSLPAFRSFSV